MSERVFVPLTDELLYDHPEQITGPITPYCPDRPCHHWLAVEVLGEDSVGSRRMDARAPRLAATG